MIDIQIGKLYTNKFENVNSPFKSKYLVATPLDIKNNLVKYKYWLNPIKESPAKENPDNVISDCGISEFKKMWELVKE